MNSTADKTESGVKEADRALVVLLLTVNALPSVQRVCVVARPNTVAAAGSGIVLKKCWTRDMEKALQHGRQSRYRLCCLAHKSYLGYRGRRCQLDP
jgi:hypothetical protein